MFGSSEGVGLAVLGTFFYPLSAFGGCFFFFIPLIAHSSSAALSMTKSSYALSLVLIQIEALADLAYFHYPFAHKGSLCCLELVWTEAGLQIAEVENLL